jgi:hypothetical protein
MFGFHFTKNSLLFPNISKLVLGSALFLLFGFAIWPAIIESLVTDWYPIGFPLAIHAEGLCYPSYVCIEFAWKSMVIDAVFWYVISAVLIQARVPFWRLLIYFIGAIVAIVLIAFLILWIPL